MSRPKRKRKIENPPVMEGFKPFGIPILDLEPEILLYEEYESIRLSDYLGMNQDDAARIMNVSRATFTRIYEQARRTIAKAFVEGKVIFIKGGDYITDDYWYRCNLCMKVNITSEEINNCTFCHSHSLCRLNV